MNALSRVVIALVCAGCSSAYETTYRQAPESWQPGYTMKITRHGEYSITYRSKDSSFAVASWERRATEVCAQRGFRYFSARTFESYEGGKFRYISGRVSCAREGPTRINRTAPVFSRGTSFGEYVSGLAGAAIAVAAERRAPAGSVSQPAGSVNQPSVPPLVWLCSGFDNEGKRLLLSEVFLFEADSYDMRRVSRLVWDAYRERGGNEDLDGIPLVCLASNLKDQQAAWEKQEGEREKLLAQFRDRYGFKVVEMGRPMTR